MKNDGRNKKNDCEDLDSISGVYVRQTCSKGDFERCFDILLKWKYNPSGEPACGAQEKVRFASPRCTNGWLRKCRQLV